MKYRSTPNSLGLAGLLAILVLASREAPPSTPKESSAAPAQQLRAVHSPATPAYSFCQKTEHDLPVLTADNLSYQMQVECHPEGITITPSAENQAGPAWTFTLANQQARPTPPHADGDRATYHHGPFQQEWFINSEKGIEHGMTLTAPPSSREAPLIMDFAVSSGLRGEQAGDNQLIFKDGSGAPTLRYEKLFAYDARGRDIPTALAWNAASSTISWRVDHQGFEYPITIDPVIATFSQTIVTPAAATVSFGDAIAISGNFMAVGAPSTNRIYLYEKSAGSWILFSRKNFIVSPAANGGTFGGQVLMPDLDTIITSDPSFDAPTSTGGTNANQGALFVFGRNVGGDNNWGLIRQFTATDFQLPNGELADRLGTFIACSNGTIAASAVGDTDTYDTTVKSIYLFEKDRGGADNWGQVPGVRIQGLNFASGFNYGSLFDLSGDLLVVGSPAENYQATPQSPTIQFQGAVYLYGRNQGGANQWGLLPNGRRYAADGLFGDFFGRWVSISGDLIAIGANSVDLSASQADAGAVYILSRNQGGANNWGFLPGRLTAADAAAGDAFGAFVDLAGDVLAVRASSDDVAGTNNAGSVYLYERSPGGPASFAAVPSGKFSIDNVSNIEKVNSPVVLTASHLAFSSDPVSAGNSAISLINLSGTTGSAELGKIQYTPQGVVNFTPFAAGTYQLRTSINLSTWANQGSTQVGIANTPLTWNTGTPGSEPKRFYRIETP
ncbi:FG-GAP repeat protein [Luteolibacter sp. Populi]|uniref:FG-GAP repeat protein n=1 Tax=Luteolibacter sp. Populi TaxID=3230487 RepID=UPI003465B926